MQTFYALRQWRNIADCVLNGLRDFLNRLKSFFDTFLLFDFLVFVLIIIGYLIVVVIQVWISTSCYPSDEPIPKNLEKLRRFTYSMVYKSMVYFSITRTIATGIISRPAQRQQHTHIQSAMIDRTGLSHSKQPLFEKDIVRIKLSTSRVIWVFLLYVSTNVDYVHNHILQSVYIVKEDLSFELGFLVNKPFFLWLENANSRTNRIIDNSHFE